MRENTAAEVLRAPNGKFAPGTPSPNPGGRPYIAVEFRQRCRSLVMKMVARAERRAREIERIETLPPDEQQRALVGKELPQILTGQELATLRELADRGGLLTGQALAEVEALRAETLANVLRAADLAPEARPALVEHVTRYEAEALGNNVEGDGEAT